MTREITHDVRVLQLYMLVLGSFFFFYLKILSSENTQKRSLKEFFADIMQSRLLTAILLEITQREHWPALLTCLKSLTEKERNPSPRVNTCQFSIPFDVSYRSRCLEAG